tara:strand:- start:2153 stop:2563 length:411 start_codon:yes stop_codon:yes gene_type:complete
MGVYLKNTIIMKINNHIYMNFTTIALMMFIIIVVGFGISTIFTNQLVMEQGYALGVVTTALLFTIFNKNTNIKKFKSHSHTMNLFALSLAFVGGFLWAVGEWLVYLGKKDHELLDPIGAASCCISALIALILFINS